MPAHLWFFLCLDDTTPENGATWIVPGSHRGQGRFELTQEKYRSEGYLGCLLGGLGQELSGVSEVFRGKIESCFSEMADRMTVCLEEARQRGDIPAAADARLMACLVIDCWEGAALRSRLRQDAAPLDAMLDFYFRSAAAQ